MGKIPYFKNNSFSGWILHSYKNKHLLSSFHDTLASASLKVSASIYCNFITSSLLPLLHIVFQNDRLPVQRCWATYCFKENEQCTISRTRLKWVDMYNQTWRVTCWVTVAHVFVVGVTDSCPVTLHNFIIHNCHWCTVLAPHIFQSVYVLWLCLIFCLYQGDEETEQVRQKPYCPTLTTNNPKMCQKNERCFPTASLWQIRIVWKLAAESSKVFLHTKHSFFLSPTPNTWLPALFLIKPINRGWHDTRSATEKQKNMSLLYKCETRIFNFWFQKSVVCFRWLFTYRSIMLSYMQTVNQQRGQFNLSPAFYFF